MIGRILFGFCSISTTIMMVMGTLFIRNTPKLMRLFFQIIRYVFYLSYLIYQWLLTWIQNHLDDRSGVDLLHNPHRIIACCLLSLCFLFLINLLRDKSFSIWTVMGAISHGVLIGFLWQEFFEPTGLDLGESLW